MIRVRIIAGSHAQQQAIGDLLRDEDRVQIVESPGEFADVFIATEDARRIPAGASVVLLTHREALQFVRQNDAQIRAWLPPEVTADELLAAVFAAAQNLTVLTPEQARRYLPQPSAATQIDDGLVPENLTNREQQVLRMMADGLANKEIAGRLGISDHTAKFHVAQILAKLGAATRTEAVTIAIRRGLVPI